MAIRLTGCLALVFAACATTPSSPHGPAWANERYEAATRYCDNEYRKQWKEYLTGIEFVSSDYAVCLKRARAEYGNDVKVAKGS